MSVKAGVIQFPRSVTTAAGLAAFCLACAILYWAQAILIPLALAVLITFLLTPLVIRCQRLGLPKAVAVPTVVLGALGAVGVVGWAVGSQLVSLTEEFGKPERKDRIVRNVEQFLDHVPWPGKAASGEGGLVGLFTEIRRKIEVKTDAEGPDPVLVEVRESLPQSFAAVLGPVVAPLVTAGLVAVLVIFMLSKREDLRNRIVTLSGRAHVAVTTQALDEAGQRIARYLLMQFVINVTYGLAVTIGLFLIGVDYAVLWGVAAAVLRYVPYIGPWVAAVLPVTFSLLSYGGWQPAWVIGLIVVLELLSNNVMEPLLYGRGVGVSAVAIILSAVFWGWLWGAIGLVLATPLTACLVVAGRYVPAFSFFNRIFGDAPEVEPQVVYYQRLLARDEDEAEEVLSDAVSQDGLAEAFESIAVPALEFAKRDRMRGVIDPDREAYVVEAVREHVDELAGDDEPPAEPSTPDAELPLVFGYAVRDAEDEAAIALLARLVRDMPCRFETLSRDLLLSEVLAEIRERRPIGLFLVGLPPGGLSHARSLLKRFRTAVPELNLAVGRWGGALPEKHRSALLELGATYVGRTVAESAQHVLSMARLRPAETAVTSRS